MKAEIPSGPEQVRQAARYVLFVEGAGDESFDPSVLKVLLPMIEVRALGPASSIRAAAEAMHRHHPDYYFLIDRDYHSDDVVEASWQRFPDPEHRNILIWRRRELENYLVTPEYFCRSQWITCDPERLCDRIRTFCCCRLYFEAANLVLIERRETAKQTGIELLTNPADAPTSDDGLRHLLARLNSETWVARAGSLADRAVLTGLYHQTMDRLTGGAEDLEFGRGTWLREMSGKSIYKYLVNQCCRVTTRSDAVVQDGEATRMVAKDLLHLPLETQPDDFRKLRRMIEAIVSR